MEATTTKMPNIFIVDVILYIFRFLDIEDKIAFALSCQQSRQLCIDGGVFRKMDLSRCLISTTQQGAVNKFFEDRQLTQHIRDLSLSNLRALNWQMDDHLQKFIKSICPHLEALHVLDCGVTLKTLQCILQEAPQLTTLSWSIWDFTSEDVEFLSKTMQSTEGICIKNIKHLHLQMNDSKSHIQIAKYLVLSCCRDLEELEVYTWGLYNIYSIRESFPLGAHQMVPGFCQQTVENKLEHLHSLVVAIVGTQCVYYNENYRSGLSDFVVSVLSRKSSSTNWKKFCILPTTIINREHFSRFLHSDDFHSIEAIAADRGWLANEVDEMKTFFRRIGDNTIRSLQFHLPPDSDSIVEFCEPISRVGGHSLKYLHLPTYPCFDIIRAEQNVFIHTLFSNCSNITELVLLCSFAKDVCEPLSKLKHLTKLQLMRCAISSKHSNGNEVEISKANLLTFVENCKKITHLDVLGYCYHGDFKCHLTDNDLLALAKLRNLKSLTLHYMFTIREWTFLKYISEHCRFLTTLRISAWNHFNSSHIPILMESSRFLKHLVIKVNVPFLESEVFWYLLSHAKGLERLCITSCDKELLNVPVALETIKSLPRLHVLHLHNKDIENVADFYDQIISILEANKSDGRLSFEIVTKYGKNTWINHPTGSSLISNKALHLNSVELCDMTPVLDIPRF